MASTLRTPAIRHILRQQPLSTSRFCQRRWAQVQHVRLLSNTSVDEKILQKYREKLEQKAKEAGVQDIEDLKQAYKDKIERLRKEAAVPGATAPLSDAVPPPPTSSPASSTTSTSTSSTPQQQQPQQPASPWPAPPPPPTPQDINKPPPGVKILNSFLDLDKIRPLPNKEIETLWRLRHASNEQSLHFSLPATTFYQLLLQARKHPNFVLPLPREIPADNAPEGSAETQKAAELHYLQFAYPHTHTTTLLFTSLAEFKLRGEFASPHTTITFHSELADSHELVLGQGLVVEGRGVSVEEARFLLMSMQKFYVVGGEEGRSRRELLEMFTRGDGGFSVDKLLDEAEKIV